MASLLDARVDALEDAIYEKAIMSASSDRTARRKIEGVFARFITSGQIGTDLTFPVFKRSVGIYLNGVDQSDVDVLTERYQARVREGTPGLAPPPKMVCVAAFLDNVFHVATPHSIDERLFSFGDHNATKHSTKHSSKNSSNATNLRKKSDSTHKKKNSIDHARRPKREEEDIKENNWTFFEENDDETLNSSKSKSLEKKLRVQSKHKFSFMDDDPQDRLVKNDIKIAKFILGFRRYLIRRASEEQKKLPASRRLMVHPSALSEKVARRLLAQGFVEAQRHQKQSSSESGYFDKQLRPPPAESLRHLSLPLDAFGALLASAREPGLSMLDQDNVSTLWWKCDQGKYLLLVGSLFPESDDSYNVFQNDAAVEHVASAPEMGPFDLQRSGDRNISIGHKYRVPSSIRYSLCRTTVSPPSNFDPTLIAKSAKTPKSSLELVHVFGFNGAAGSPNLFVASEGSLVFAVAATVVIHDPVSSTQRVFTGHSDDVSALTVDRTGLLAASGQIGFKPFVLVWDVVSLEIKQKVGVGFFDEIVYSIAFSGDASYLVTVGQTQKQYLGVWNVATGDLFADMVSCGGHSPSIHTIACEPVDEFKKSTVPSQFVTIGAGSQVIFYFFERDALRNHKVRRGTSNHVPLSRKVGTLGRFDQANVSKASNLTYRPTRIAMNAAVFIRGGKHALIATGASNGKVYLWQDCRCIGLFQADDWSIKSIAFLNNLLVTGSSSSSLRFFEIQNNFKLVGSLAVDEKISRKITEEALLFENSHLGGDMNESEKALLSGEVCFNKLKSKYSASHLTLYGSRNIYVGSSNGEIFKVHLGALQSEADNPNANSACIQRASIEPLMVAHSGEVTAVAAHPVTPGLFFTAGADRKLIVWSARRLSTLSFHRLPAVPTSLDVSSPELGVIAVGFVNGSVRVYAVKTMSEISHKSDVKDEISALSFSPNNSYLAVGNRSNSIHVYSVEKGYRLHKCLRGHTSFIESLDWTTDSANLMSACASKEILYWDILVGKQVVDTDRLERDAHWASWSSKIGFPVMGIWGKGQVLNDVNDVSRSRDLVYVAVATDDAAVRVFNYPCVVNEAPALELRAHSGHVTGICFLTRLHEHGEHLLVSVGGGDRSVMLWRVTSHKKLAAPQTPD